jgi:predicted nuclease of predicted toxin-antitoxin system
MNFFADHCVPESICRMIEDLGHEVTRLRHVLPQDAKDSEVIKKAKELGFVLVSLNGDFAHIVNYPPAKYSGIIAIQLKNDPRNLVQLKEQLAKLFDSKTNHDFIGKLVIVDNQKFRVRL